ncbi:MAG: long-chain fatty acid--CoA ligase [Bacteroidales bacterium]|jgi:long-chain acyl-CoA synthetase|nr:long-chain fatty acid--CoA ligase [Bacteroidales bacterium]
MIHFASLIQTQAKKYGEKPAFRCKDPESGRWNPTSWNQFNELVSKVALAFGSAGIKVQENVAICSQNMAECIIAEFGLFQNRAVSVPIYATSSSSQIEYIVNDASVRFLLVGEQQQYDNAWKASSNCPTLAQIIIFDQKVKKHQLDKSSVYLTDFLQTTETADAPQLVNERIASATIEDTAAILYTSGTTGEPKGAVLLHSNFQEAMRIHPGRLPDITDKDLSMSFLPMTHVFEKTWVFFCLTMGTEIAINHDPKAIQTTIKEVRPTIMCSVPRFWEKVYEAVQEKINSSGTVTKKIFLDAIETGRKHNIEYINEGKKPPMALSIKYKLYDKTIYALLKKTIGIEKGNFFPTAGAALSDNINIFLHAVGIHILYGYGLTESTATVCCFWKTGYKIGTVGTIMPGVEVKIGENNEILLKGETIIKGYYNKPEENAKSFVDGWFKTGDAGTLVGNRIIMKERIKDLFKTSNGKYVAPQAIETKIGEDKYIDQIAIIGNNRKYVTALIVPAYPALQKYAQENKIDCSDMNKLVNNEQIIELYRNRINALQVNFANYEQIKKFTLLPQPFSMENGELTNTLKMKRLAIEGRYAADIKKMYE